MFYKSGTYREVIRTPTISFCAVLKYSTENILIKKLAEDVIKSVPNLLKGCPFKANQAIYQYNFTLPTTNAVAFLPTGDFKAEIHFMIKPTTEEVALGFLFFSYKNAFSDHKKNNF